MCRHWTELTKEVELATAQTFDLVGEAAKPNLGRADPDVWVTRPALGKGFSEGCSLGAAGGQALVLARACRDVANALKGARRHRAPGRYPPS